tara:strand:- start:306 stop:1499 length:1194 start_codon:yes stop_codon:yes gene_type:complete
MGGGLMQLVAYGAQDIYLTGNPQITFFKVVYRRHTNFSMEAIQQTFNGSVGFGNTVSATISRNGDLVHRMYVETQVAPTTVPTNNYCSNYGSAIIKECELEIGGQKIDKHYGHWLETRAQLMESGARLPVAMNATMSDMDSSIFQSMSCSGGVNNNDFGDVMTDGHTLHIPLQFWFCRNPGLALPLIALQYHEVKVQIVIAVASGENGLSDAAMLDTSLDFNLWCDYIYLDTDERRRFAQVSHEYLIEQLQYQSFSTATTMELNLNHPVKELIWTGVPANTANGTDTGPSTPTTLGVGNYQLKLNGHDRFAARKLRYFTQAQIWAHHTGAGGVNSINSIGVYSFALKPEEHQPSGTCNFSRIDNAQFITPNQPLNMYAVNYNVLRIMSGMGGLAYSN